MTSPDGPERPVWVCDAGTVVGWRDDGVDRATGIRYARAGRHEAPAPEPRASEPIDAIAWAPACPQARVPFLDDVLADPMGDLAGDEHCQRLSVTLPQGTNQNDRLPVLVWIHGGSYTSGAGDMPIFDAAPIVREQGVVMVSVTYRLGLFGYLGSEGGRPANLGLLDQVEALRWVRRNIAAFGGDPTNVTAVGQSAGADAVAHLMVADGAERLFRRAIVMSAPFGISLGRARMNAAMAAEATTIPADAPAEDVVAAQERVVARAAPFGLRAAMPFGAQYGLAPLPPEGELDEAWRRAASRIDVLIGCTSREAALFVPTVPATERLSRARWVGRPATEALVALVSGRVYGAGLRRFVRRHRRGGGRGYRYLLSWGAPGNPYAGAHTVDLPLLFGNGSAWRDAPLIAGASWDDVDAAGRELRRLWASFARDGRLPRTTVPGVLSVRPL